MERDEIIRKVIAEVEQRLAETAGRTGPRRLALVEPGPGLPAVLGRLLQVGDVTAVLCGRAARAPETSGWGQVLPLLPDNIDQLERDVLPGLELLILPNLRPGTVARIALGMHQGTVPCLAQAALWAGVPIVATPGWDRQAGPEPYRQMFEGYLQRLREFGVQVDPAPGASGGPAAPTAPPVPTAGAAPFEGRLLTEAGVLDLLTRNIRSVELPKGTLVTALALDTARARGLRLIRR